MRQTRSESCDTPSVPCHDSLPYDPACVLCKHIDSWCSIFVTMKVQKPFTVVRHVMSSWAIAICVWKRINYFLISSKQSLYFLCQQRSTWSSVPRFPLLPYISLNKARGLTRMQGKMLISSVVSLSGSDLSCDVSIHVSSGA